MPRTTSRRTRCSRSGTAGTGCGTPSIQSRTHVASSPTSPAPGSAARSASGGVWPSSGPADRTAPRGPTCRLVVDVQGALRELPFRKRACVVLRHAFDLSEKDTALTLGVSVGTVKSQTSKGMAELERRLGHGELNGRTPGDVRSVGAALDATEGGRG